MTVQLLSDWCHALWDFCHCNGSVIAAIDRLAELRRLRALSPHLSAQTQMVKQTKRDVEKWKKRVEAEQVAVVQSEVKIKGERQGERWRREGSDFVSQMRARPYIYNCGHYHH